MKQNVEVLAASRDKRISAGVIDSILSAVFGYIAVLLASGHLSDEIADKLTDQMQTGLNESQFISILTSIPELTRVITTSIAVMLFYYIPELLTPQSFGKYVTKIKIVSSDGSPASAMQRLVRFVVKNIPFLALLALAWDPQNTMVVYSAVSTLTFAGMALIFLPERMALYDYVAKTKVIDTRTIPVVITQVK